jgi:hypothetical protein
MTIILCWVLVMNINGLCIQKPVCHGLIVVFQRTVGTVIKIFSSGARKKTKVLRRARNWHRAQAGEKNPLQQVVVLSCQKIANSETGGFVPRSCSFNEERNNTVHVGRVFIDWNLLV